MVESKNMTRYTFIRIAGTKYAYLLNEVVGEDVLAENIPVGKQKPHTGMRKLSFCPAGWKMKRKGYEWTCAMYDHTGKTIQFGIIGNCERVLYYADDCFVKGHDNALLFEFLDGRELVNLYVFHGLADKKQMLFQKAVRNSLDLLPDAYPLIE